MALKLNEAYPGRFNNPSPEYPQGSFKNRTTPTAEDGSYFEQQWANDHLAFLSSLLDGAGVEANGSVDQVGASQYYDALQSVINATAKDYLNTTRIDVASAATVNLTTGAPNTRNIRITGTSAISAFTVAVGQRYLVQAGGDFSIANNASIVTNSGASLNVRAGDSFEILATASNTVSVTLFTKGVNRKSNAANGYRIVEDGTSSPLIIQWGTYAGGAVGPTITFPIAFPSLTASIVCTSKPAATSGGSMVEVLSPTLTNFIGRVDRFDGTDLNSGFYWMATGF